jgi:hypothetical protein
VAAPTIQAIMEGIETRLETISGLRTAEYVPDQINPPQAVVDFPGDITYHEAFAHGKFRVDPTVMILVSKVVDRVGTAALAAYASPTGTNSIHAAIEGDRTLGGVVDDCIVVSFRRLGQEEIDGLGFFGGVFTLHVIATGV